MKPSLKALAAALLCALAAPALESAAVAQRVTTPPAGSAQRSAILDVLRPSIETELHGRVEFVVDRLRVGRGWALLWATPQRPGGRAIDPRVMPDHENRDGVMVTALLHFTNSRWRVVDYQIGATDVWYCSTEFPAPAAVTGC
jgi:hypothetical protein